MKRFLLALLLWIIPVAAFGISGDPILIPGSTEITTLGTVTTGTWNGTPIGVPYGGTGTTVFTNGGILIGSGTAAISSMNVLPGGCIVIGDGSEAPTYIGAFTSASGNLKHEYGGLEANVSSYSNGVPMINGGVTSALTFYDDDTMASDDATGLASQQSIKAYVDSHSGSGGGSWGAGVAKTVANGVINTDTSKYIIVTGEGDTTDYVTALYGTSEGDVVIIKGKASLGYTITFVDDNANLDLQTDFQMNNQNDTLVLLCVAGGPPGTFIEISRASND
jgi:hypothetical protein